MLNINALQIDWKDYVKPNCISYIVGNPHFISKHDRNKEQENDMNLVFEKIKKHGILDYVSAWYKKAADYIDNTNIEAAFVSTNSIIQGEQIEPLWIYLFSKDIVINFAHRPFKWKNGLSNNAAVFVVIISFSKKPRSKRYIYDYADISSEPLRLKTKKLAEIPYAFGEIRQPNSEYICIPRHSSERRKYIPIALFSAVDIVNDSCIAVYSNELYIMGILMSSMHMAWVKRIGGRIK